MLVVPPEQPEKAVVLVLQELNEQAITALVAVRSGPQEEMAVVVPPVTPQPEIKLVCVVEQDDIVAFLVLVHVTYKHVAVRIEQEEEGLRMLSVGPNLGPDSGVGFWKSPIVMLLDEVVSSSGGFSSQIGFGSFGQLILMNRNLMQRKWNGFRPGNCGNLNVPWRIVGKW